MGACWRCMLACGVRLARLGPLVQPLCTVIFAEIAKRHAGTCPIQVCQHAGTFVYPNVHLPDTSAIPLVFSMVASHVAQADCDDGGWPLPALTHMEMQRSHAMRAPRWP